MKGTTLDQHEGAALVKVARQAIEAHLSRAESRTAPCDHLGLKERRGVFVTLLDHSNGNSLRGCIGIPFPNKSLLEEVRLAAIEAAIADSRFDPLGLEEVKNIIVIETTVLSLMEPIWVKSRLDLRDNIVVGRHGIMVAQGRSRGILLPQVAVDEGFDGEEFLSQCCLKADLPPDAWLLEKLQVSRFEGQIFAEDWPSGSVSERRLRLEG